MNGRTNERYLASKSVELYNYSCVNWRIIVIPVLQRAIFLLQVKCMIN